MRLHDIARMDRVSNVAGLLYGVTVSAGTMAVLGAHIDDSSRVAIATLTVLGVYWLADVYAHALSTQLRGSDTKLLVHRFATSARGEVSVLIGGIPAIAIYLVEVSLGVEPGLAIDITLCLVVVALFWIGYAGARRAGLTGLLAFEEAFVAGLFGVLIIVMKALLH